MHQSRKEMQVLHPVNRTLQLDYHGSLKCAKMLDEMAPDGAIDRFAESSEHHLRVRALL